MCSRRSLVLLTTVAVLACGSQPLFAQVAELDFEEVIIDPNVGKVCYALALEDIDGDGKDDIVAVTENRVLWYRNPDWTAQVMIENQTPSDNVCIAPQDIDGDGKIDFALGASWTGPNEGTIHWITRGETLEDPWEVHSIGAERWLHRMRWADVLGNGVEQLVISPLNATEANGVRLTAFEIPENPETDRWPSTVLNAELNRMHNHWQTDLDDDGAIDTLTASREGVNLISRDEGEFTRTQIGSGAEAEEQNARGAGEIRVGQTANGQTFLVTVEPMHGTMLAVYLPPKETGDLWERIVVDEGFQRGHALSVAGMNKDGREDIVFGHSDTPDVFGVRVYYGLDDAGRKWQKQVVDAGGMATEDLVVGDLTGDGYPDIVAGGRQTSNVKLYVNPGAK